MEFSTNFCLCGCFQPHVTSLGFRCFDDFFKKLKDFKNGFFIEIGSIVYVYTLFKVAFTTEFPNGTPRIECPLQI